jgi:hypothetical protein
VSAQRGLHMAPSSGSRMSAIPPLLGGKQTSGERGEIDAHVMGFG